MTYPSSGTSRRSFLRWSRRVGLTSVGVLAGLTAAQQTADAGIQCIMHACCCLIRPSGGCPGSGAGHTCPAGYTKKLWGCCQGPRNWGCSECTKTTGTCHSATLANTACSEHWSIGLVC